MEEACTSGCSVVEGLGKGSGTRGVAGDSAVEAVGVGFLGIGLNASNGFEGSCR